MNTYQPNYVAPSQLDSLVGRMVTVYIDGTYTTGTLTAVGRSATHPRHLRLQLNGDAAKCDQSLPDDKPWRVEHLSPEAHLVYTHTVRIGGTP